MRTSACSRRWRDGRWVLGLVGGASHFLHRAPRAGRGRFASGAVAKRSKSGEGAFPQAETRGTAPSSGFLRCARNPTSPRTRGEVEKVQRLRDDQLVPVALAAFSKSSIPPLPTGAAISV